MSVAAGSASASASLIARNLRSVRSRIVDAVSKSPFKQQCTLVAVSKTKPVEDLKAAYDEGQRHFGENYIQELIQKAPQLPSDIKWHFIGHVQSNKAKALVRDVPNLFCIETVDSIKIANALNKASKEFRPNTSHQLLHVMVQVNTSEEDQKSGLDYMENKSIIELAQHIVTHCDHLKLMGLMTIGKYGETTSTCFDRLVQVRKQVAEALKREEKTLDLSMGMSSDYPLAIVCGSTFVRVGSMIFGERD